MNVKGRLFRRVTYFKYLGHLTKDNDLKTKNEYKITKE